MGELGLAQQLRWIFAYRVATLALVAFLLPPLAPAAWPQLPWLAGVAIALVVFWAAPFWEQARREPGRVALALAAEGLLVGAIAAACGGPATPPTLLLLPILAHAAIALPTRRYVPVAAFTLAAIAPTAYASTRALPAWTLLAAVGLALAAVWLGVAGAALQRERETAVRAARQGARYEALVASLPTMPEDAGAEDGFWPGFLGQVARAGGFLGAALVRFEGDRPVVVSPERLEAWQGLAGRQVAVFREAAEGLGPRLLQEAPGGGRPPRTIVAWPVPRRGAGHAGALCVLAPGAVALDEVGRRLARYLPVASLALALAGPRLVLHRRPTDWRVIMNAILHRLHGRLARYLVLVHVEEGTVEADARLLASAITQVIEAALDVTPPNTPVRLDVRREGTRWRFRVETERRPDDAPEGRTLALARQVIDAHDGTWEQVEEGAARRIGFMLPAGGPDAREALPR